MAPLSFLSSAVSRTILSRPSELSTPWDYLPFVVIAVAILLLIMSCGDDDAPVGPRRRDISVSIIYAMEERTTLLKRIGLSV